MKTYKSSVRSVISDSTSILEYLKVDTLAEPHIFLWEWEEYWRELAKEYRINNCRSWKTKLNLLEGEWFSYKMRCGYWRECELCFQDRIQEFTDRFAVIWQKAEKSVWVIPGVSGAEANRIVRSLRKRQLLYWRVPTEDGYYIFSEECSDKHLSMLCSSDDFNWDLLASTPHGLRPSGKLGLTQKKEVIDEPSITVNIPDWHIELPEGVSHQSAYNEAQERVELVPLQFSAEVLAERVLAHKRALQEVVAEMGGEITHKGSSKVRVSLSMYRSSKEEEIAIFGTPDPDKGLRIMVQLGLQIPEESFLHPILA